MSKVDVKSNFRNLSRTKNDFFVEFETSIAPLEKTIEEKEASISKGNPTIKLNFSYLRKRLLSSQHKKRLFKSRVD